MQLQARLVHADGPCRIVLVTAREGERVLGSALGEAPTAEEAEDRARTRLLGRLAAAAPGAETMRRPTPPLPTRLSPIEASESGEAGSSSAQVSSGEGETLPGVSGVPTEPAAAEEGPPQPATAVPAPAPPEPPVDPEDWSAELAQLDLQLQRLGWGRDQEAIYLQRAFGHPSRNRLTTYTDLLAYLRAIEGFAAPLDPATAPVPLRRGDLLGQCDQLLAGLGWGAEQGRAFLQEQFGSGSRRELSDGQLLQFNMLLEEQLMRLQGADATFGLPQAPPRH